MKSQTKTSNEVPTVSITKVKKSKAVVFAVIGWSIIAVAVILIVGFLLGKSYAERQNNAINAKAVSIASSLKQ